VEAVSPEIAGAGDDVIAASGRAWQAGLHPNPSLELERDGPADDRPWGRSAFKVGVRQPIVVSDRRRLAVSAEIAERDARKLAVGDVRREVRAEARLAFLDVVYLRDSAALHRELIAVAQRTLDLARTRVEAKVALASESLRPELAVVSLRSELAGIDRRLVASRARLEALLGGAAVPVDRLAGNALAPSGDLASLVRQAMETNPALLVARQEVEASRGRLELARTATRPDIAVRLAVGRDFDENDYLAEIGVEIPLACFDRGQGAVLEARALASKARRDVESMERDLAAEISLRFGEAESARAELAGLRERMLPLAERTLQATLEEYASGRREFVDVLDAQRTFLEARAAALALERDAALADAEILTLTGDKP
jgi:cobalt-zinc-cadmium efflux system outer membrane protein